MAMVPLRISAALLLLGMCSELPVVAGNKTVEVVLARYDEDTSWTNGYPETSFTIYNKGSPPLPAAKQNIENVGRESDTYLHHIIENYDSLADWTVFSQASAPSVGHSFGDRQSGHMVDGVKFDDYLQPNDDSYFVFSCASAFPECFETERLSMCTDRTRRSMRGALIQEKTPGSKCPAQISEWDNWWYHHEHAHVTRLQQTESLSPLEFYSTYIAERPIAQNERALFVFA
jgi:hypothetical protein